MRIALEIEKGKWQEFDVVQAIIPVGIESEVIAVSVINGGEVVVIRHGMAYPDGGECVWSELLAENDG